MWPISLAIRNNKVGDYSKYGLEFETSTKQQQRPTEKHQNSKINILDNDHHKKRKINTW